MPRAGPRRILGILPLFHVFAMTVIMNWALFEGAEMILMPRFKLEDLLRIIARKKPTVMAGVPTVVQRHAECARSRPS